jgi:hypothetical protein
VLLGGVDLVAGKGVEILGKKDSSDVAKPRLDHAIAVRVVSSEGRRNSVRTHRADQRSAGPSPEPDDAASAGVETVEHSLHDDSGDLRCSCSIRAPSGGGARWRTATDQSADRGAKYTVSPDPSSGCR